MMTWQMQACTIIARNYLAHARVLAASFAEHHPDGRFTVMVIDGLDGFADAAAEPFEVMTPDDLDLDFPLMATRYDVLELSTAVKPWLMRRLLEDDDHIVYLDPDIQLFSPLEDVAALARLHGVLLTPHITTPMPRDGKRPTEQDILMAGTYNLGFLALGAGEATDGLLDWWEERLEHDCIVDPTRGFFVDQRWMDFIPGLVPDTHLLRDTGYNVAYWNLHGRTLSKSDAGGYLVDGGPLRFMHFSGYDPLRPERLSKHQTRVDLRDPVLRELADDYGRRLLAAGYETTVGWPYGYATSASGIPLTKVLRRAHSEAVTDGRLSVEPFDPRGEQEFFAWLAEPAAVGGALGITRYMEVVYADRPDLQRAYPDIANGDAAGMIGWFQVEAPKTLIPPPGTVPAPVAADAAIPSETLGVNVVGYLRSEHGVGEVARQAVRALQAGGVPVMPIGEVATASRQGHDFAHHGLDDARHPINLLCVNADQTPALAERAGAGFFEDRHTIGWWWWEVEQFPSEWLGAFDHVDEVWAGSRFVAETLARISPVPVVHVPMPVELPPGIVADRAGLGLPDGFLFLFSFDYNSVFARKNPLGAVAAFVRAFPEPRPGGPTLVLKSINGESHPAERDRLTAAVADRPDIVLREDYLDVADKNALMASCDCYVSLHRSEGFGITIAEAMLLERPVIATDYSGSEDLLADDRAWPIGYARVPIGPGAAPYPAGAEWAEPDVEAAARAMVEAVADPLAAAESGRRAAAYVREHHSARAAGTAMRERLTLVMERRAARPPAPAAGRPDARLDSVEALLRQGPPRAAWSRLDPRRWIRAASLRLGRPQARHQHRIDAELTASTSYLFETTLDHVDAVARRAQDDDVRTRRRMADLTTVVGTVQSANDALRAELAAMADQLSQLQQADASARRHLAGLQGFADAMPDVAALERELRALPYMAHDALTLRDEEYAGRVLGYRAEAGEAAPEAAAPPREAFERVFRGSRETVRERQRPYVELLRDRQPVLDAGCGRGEFLDLLAGAGLPAIGVDPDPALVAACRALGHEDVHATDVNAWLQAREDDSLGAIFAAQLVEHVAADELDRFLALARRTLRPDGLLVVEAVNPHALHAMKTFWVDPQHRRPVFPEALLLRCRAAGFAEAFAFHVGGSGDYEADRETQGDYTVVARPGL